MSNVDWSEPLEAVHEDGRVVTPIMMVPDGFGGTNPDKDGHYWMWIEGELFCITPVEPEPVRNGWHIRNVQPAAATDIPKDVVERMVALVHSAKFMGVNSNVSRMEIGQEAWAIAALLPKPVDPDLVAAREIAAANDVTGHWRDDCIAGKWDEHAIVKSALAGIHHGRTTDTQL